MDIEKLKIKILNLEENTDLKDFNNLIKLCVDRNEMGAVVYLYDKMIERDVKPDKNTYTLINKLHSKTIPESKQIVITYTDGKSRLQPRRRIHKIMKGYNYGNNYNSAKQYETKVREFLNKNPNYKTLVEQRIKLAKIISKNCGISFNDARYIITSLKRQKYFNDCKNNISKQTKISDFFKK